MFSTFISGTQLAIDAALGIEMSIVPSRMPSTTSISPPSCAPGKIFAVYSPSVAVLSFSAKDSDVVWFGSDVGEKCA